MDAFGNVAKSSAASIQVALGANPTGAVLSGTRTVAATAGVALFPDLSLSRAGTGLTLVASSSGLTDATSAAFAVVPGLPARLTLLGVPANVNTGATLPQLQVSIEDTLGNRVTTATTPVTVTFGANPSGATLGGTTSATPASGVAAFADLSVNRPGTGYTLAFSSGALPAAITTPFDVTAVAARLVFVGQPVGTLFGIPLGGPITVEVQDALGNRVTNATSSITLALGNNPNGASLGGALVQPASAGQAVFTSVALDRAGAGYTLSASATGLTGAVSGAFNTAQFSALDGLGHLDGGSLMDFLFGNANDTINGSQLNQASAVELDRARHRLFVADRNSHRVLVFQLSASDDFTGQDRRADFVLGQPDFHASGPGTTATTLRNPGGLAYDAAGDRLFVADTSNHRVLVYSTAILANGQAAVNVLGQADFVTSTPATTPSGLQGPVGLRYLSGDRLAVADAGRQRLGRAEPVWLERPRRHRHRRGRPQALRGRSLVFKITGAVSNGMPAATSIGESGFTGGAGSPQQTLSIPNGLDSVGGRMYLADSNAHRVTLWTP